MSIARTADNGKVEDITRCAHCDAVLDLLHRAEVAIFERDYVAAYALDRRIEAAVATACVVHVDELDDDLVALLDGEAGR